VTTDIKEIMGMEIQIKATKEIMEDIDLIQTIPTQIATILIIIILIIKLHPIDHLPQQLDRLIDQQPQPPEVPQRHDVRKLIQQDLQALQIPPVQAMAMAIWEFNLHQLNDQSLPIPHIQCLEINLLSISFLILSQSLLRVHAIT
jgi:hypothetical protein